MIPNFNPNKWNREKILDYVIGEQPLTDEQLEFLNYFDNLQKQVEEKDKTIDEIEKRCNQEISAATIQYERHKRNDTWQYIIAHKRILEILERGKN